MSVEHKYLHRKHVRLIISLGLRVCRPFGVVVRARIPTASIPTMKGLTTILQATTRKTLLGLDEQSRTLNKTPSFAFMDVL